MKLEQISISLDESDRVAVLNTSTITGKFMIWLGPIEMHLTPAQAKTLMTGLEQMLMDTYPTYVPQGADEVVDPEDVNREHGDPF